MPRTATFVLAGVLALGGVAACSDSEQDQVEQELGETGEQIEEGANDVGDEVQEQVDEGAEESGEGQ